MAEYIEREAAVNLLRDEAGRGATPYHIGLYAAARALEAIPAADAIEELSKPKWIPVTERLPELHDEEYLDEVTGEMVRYKVSDPILIWLAKGGFMDIGMYERSDAVDDFCYQGVPHTVTYWASLPEPPKEEMA